MKKIAILLLLASSSFLVASELAACKRGVDARERAVGGGVTLLVTGDEQTINGGNACAFYKDPVKDVRKRAACIFGYNTIIPMMFDDSNVVRGNGCSTYFFPPQCPDWWKNNSAGCVGGEGSCCVCGYEDGPINSVTKKPDVYGVCKYGASIGWNLSKVRTSTLGNYYYNGTGGTQYGYPLDIIKILWGHSKNKTITSSLDYVNWLNYVKVYENAINKNGTNSVFSRDVVTVTGAEAVNQVS